MLDLIKVTKLKKWKTNYGAIKNKSLDAMTKSAVISLELLQQFIEEAKKNSPGFNGVRIYFIRYNKLNDELRENDEYTDEAYKYVSKIDNSELSQVSLAFVPVKKFNPSTLAGKDFELNDGTIYTLAICHPTDWQTDKMPKGKMLKGTNKIKIGTGLCPPKCHT
jgi:hypothetical protein